MLAVGLALALTVGALAGRADAQEVTFSRDIAPIVFGACASCHRAGGPAPFSLTTYQEVRRRATQIATVTTSRFMPPWKVDLEIGHFVGQRQLTDQEVTLIQRWASIGAPEGSPRDLPDLPRFPKGWLLGTPDLVVTLPEAYTLAAQPTDAFRIFAIPLPVSKRTYVRGIEFHPGNARVVHHANIRIDRTPASRQLDEADPLPGYDGLMARSALYPDGHFLGWTPGQVAPLVEPALSWTLEPGSDLVVQLHLQPSGAVEHVQPAIAFFFGEAPPTRTPTILRLGSQGIDIAPGDARHVIRDAYTLPVDVDLLAIQPHAHYRAREITGTATMPDGTTRLVMHIRDWDFRWQHVYRLESPMALPRGTRLSMEYIYDNSAENPANPQPPVRVLWGQRSKDEMGDLWLQVIAHGDRDLDVLTAGVMQKMTAEDIIGLETLLKADPQDAELHNDAASLYLTLGEAPSAVRHFQASLDLKPQSAAAHFNLGTALTVAGRLDEAVESFRQALTRRPDYGLAHNNLGRVLLAQGHTAEAVSHLQQAVRFDPGNASAFFNLSEAYAAIGSFDLAIAMADRALRLSPSELLAAEIRAKRERYLQSRPPGFSPGS